MRTAQHPEITFLAPSSEALKFQVFCIMEFERAIFRVYERCLDGLRDENDQNEHDSKGCRFLELLTLMATGFFLVALGLMHSQFVKSPGCLPHLLASENNVSFTLNSTYLLKYDQILNINIDGRFLPTNNKGSKSTNLRHLYELIPAEIFSEGNMSNTITNTSSAVPVASYDYQFSFDLGEMFLSDKVRKDHKFEILNVTMAGSQCFGGSTTQSLIAMGGMDTVVINALMFTFQKPGHLLTSSGEFYRWSLTDILPYGSVGDWLNFKINMVFVSCAAFFFLSTVTALLVRVLISSGVVLLFPLFHLIQYLGMQPINLRIISISYPWIGVPMEMMRARNISTTPFLIAHLTRVVLYYVLYQALQTAFSSWFYRSSSPGQPELWLFALMMVVEYYSMIYLRAKQAIQLFPRAFAALFLIFHFYYYSFPSGFHMLALAAVFSALVFLMAYCIRRFEIKAYYTGNVSIDTPRMLFSQLPWMSMRTDLAADFTLFMPVTSEAVSIYQTNVPAIGAAATGATPDAISGDATTSVVGDIESGGVGSSSSVSGGGSISGSSRNSSNSSNRQEAEMGSIEMTNAPLPPTYHDPDQLLASPTAADRFRKVPLSSIVTSSSGSSSSNNGISGGRSKRGEYTRLDNSGVRAEEEDEEKS